MKWKIRINLQTSRGQQGLFVFSGHSDYYSQHWPRCISTQSAEESIQFNVYRWHSGMNHLLVYDIPPDVENSFCESM